MRDIVIVSIVLVAAILALRRPWIGVLSWTWLSIMNPHRFAYGFSFDAPLAAIAAGSTLVGLMVTRERDLPFKGPPVTWLAIFMVWFTLSWLFGLDVKDDYPQWNKVMKIDFMILVGLCLMRSKLHILSLTWVAVASLALLGAKGGVFTILTGGGYRVWGPPGSFIEDNNEFALALVMTIPLLRFLQLQVQAKWQRHALLLAMLLCAVSALGSQSRGGLLAIVAMATLLWWRGRNRIVGGILIFVAGLALVAFMPESWSERMATIDNYEADRSAMGRISAWWNAWGIAKTHVFGVGFNAARPSLFAQFSPYPDYVHAAHSIYFQILGNHGFIGLLLFVGLWISTWRSAGWIRVNGAKQPESGWAADLAAMCQVSLAGYAVGGTFLSLAYFDLPYNIMVLVVLTRVWVATRGWEREPRYTRRWFMPPGLSAPPASATNA
ncbi:MAG TPA: putative O-glycosylation ligase, exosortase A system-associated [Aquabacterium sp.]|nr:putative O-glycosylation ligase, exosortase A system-associated [Aquabacterium sp.]